MPRELRGKHASKGIFRNDHCVLRVIVTQVVSLETESDACSMEIEKLRSYLIHFDESHFPPRNQLLEVPLSRWLFRGSALVSRDMKLGATPLGSVAANILNGKHGAVAAVPAMSPEDFFASNQDILHRANLEFSQQKAAGRRPQRHPGPDAPEFMTAKRGAMPQGGHHHERQRNAVKAAMLAQQPGAMRPTVDRKREQGAANAPGDDSAGVPETINGPGGRRGNGRRVSGAGGYSAKVAPGEHGAKAAPRAGQSGKGGEELATYSALAQASQRSPQRGMVNSDRKLLPYAFPAAPQADTAGYWGEGSATFGGAVEEGEGTIVQGPGASVLTSSRVGAGRGRAEPSAAKQHKLLLAAGWKISVGATQEWGGVLAPPQFDGGGARQRWVSPPPERISYFGLDVAWAAFVRSRAEVAEERPVDEGGGKEVLTPLEALRGGIPCSFLEPLARSWSHFCGHLSPKVDNIS